MSCAVCGTTEDLPIYDCGVRFCSAECQRLYRYRPGMTDETFRNETPIDIIDTFDDGKEIMLLQTPEAFYELYSGYKAIVTRQRMFWQKQLKGFRTIKEAQEWWADYKKKHDLKSWADSLSREDQPGIGKINMEKLAGKTLYFIPTLDYHRCQHCGMCMELQGQSLGNYIEGPGMIFYEGEPTKWRCPSCLNVVHESSEPPPSTILVLLCHRFGDDNEYISIEIEDECTIEEVMKRTLFETNS